MDINESLQKLDEFAPEVVMTIDSDWVAGLLDEVGGKYKVSLYHMLVFVCAGDLEEKDFITYLKGEFSCSDEKAGLIIKDLNENVLRKIERRLSFLSSDRFKPMPLLEEKQYLLEIFKDSLLPEFGNHPLIIDAFNSRVFYQMSMDIGIRDEIEAILYENKEVLSSKPFMVQEKEEIPTIGNWLKYFVQLEGSAMFDNVLLASFVSSAENAKRLDDAEKVLLHRLMMMYRNIKFFPESMPSDDGTGWEIIPTEKTTEPGREKQLQQNKPAGRDALIQELKGNVDNYAPGSLEREILEEEDEKDREYHKLILLKNKYPEGSLERRAVEEELRKMGR